MVWGILGLTGVEGRAVLGFPGSWAPWFGQVSPEVLSVLAAGPSQVPDAGDLA